MIDINDPGMKRALQLTEEAVDAQVSDTPKMIADAIEAVAFEIPAPNSYTPRLVQLAISVRMMQRELATARADALEWKRLYECQRLGDDGSTYPFHEI